MINMNMKISIIRHFRIIPIVLLICCFLSGCSGEKLTDEPAQRDDMPETHYEIPPFLENEYNEEEAYHGNDVMLDLTHKEEGYFAASAYAEKRLKIQVIKDDLTYNYNLDKEGRITYFPLQSGDGTYVIRVMENVVENRYAEKFRVEEEVVLKDEFQPFLHASEYVSYTEESECVQKAHELALGAADANDFITAIYKSICKTVRYDRKKAETVPSGYVPVPDETMNTGMGICFDYASLAASMLRSQGIPTKLIFGYVAPDDLYHAWNMVYTEESGWITVEFKVSQESWNRVDLTFSANGSDAKFIGNGENYADVYEY